MNLEKLPSVIRNNKWTKEGFVETDEKILVPAYVASQRGFSSPGKEFLNNRLYPRLKEECDVLPLDPFEACGEYLDLSVLNDEMGVGKSMAYWDGFNRKVGIVNYEVLMKKSKFMIAILNGIQIDDGVSSEIGYYSANIKRPIIAISTDSRLEIRPAISYLLLEENPWGNIFSGPNSIEEAITSIIGSHWLQKSKDTKGHTTELIRVGDEEYVPAIILSQAGYDSIGKSQLEEFSKELFSKGIYPLLTFSPPEEFRVTDDEAAYDDKGKMLPRLVYKELMDKAAFAIALFDGSHALNDEVCAEVGFLRGTYEKKPIIGIRSDFRLSEDPAAPINPAVRYFIDQGPYEGSLFTGPDAYKDALKKIKQTADIIRKY